LKKTLKKQIQSPWLICFLFFSLFGALSVSADETSSHGPAYYDSLEAVSYLDKIAKNFDNLHCSSKDEFCWWFLFHIRIGDSGSQSMQRFAEQVPFQNSGHFMGEAHVFQYPAYWLMKRVNRSTNLQTGQTIDQFVKNRNWPEVFRNSKDKEPSWYLIGQKFYPSLPKVSPLYSKEASCLGSHYLVGLSIDESNSLIFDKQLNLYINKLRNVTQYDADEAIYDPFKADIVVHAPESLCLSGRRDLIDSDLFYYNLEFLEAFSNEFEKGFSKVNSPESFVKADSSIAYLTASVLGHFRHGLKVCAGIQQNPLRTQSLLNSNK
jgi:hypothetical protein